MEVGLVFISRDREVLVPGRGIHRLLSRHKRTVLLLAILGVHSKGIDVLTIPLLRSETSSCSPPSQTASTSNDSAPGVKMFAKEIHSYHGLGGGEEQLKISK